MADAVHTAERLKELQALPLDRKIQISQTRIIEWYQRNKGNVVVSFSGGKDSTVLLHLVRSIYPDVPAVFSNTGLEYPEIFRFVQTFPNVEIVRPNMVFSEVISTYGYPLIGKEVAEAIYYARRIRSQSVQVEREREQGPHNALETPGTSRLPEISGGGLALQTGTPRTTDTSSTPAERRTDGQSSPTSGGAVNPDASTRAIPKRGGEGTWKSIGDGTTCEPSGKQTTFKRAELGGAERATENEALPRTMAQLRTGDETPARTGRVRETTSRGSKWGDYHRRSLNPDDGNENDRECFFNRRTEWSDWRRGCL